MWSYFHSNGQYLYLKFQYGLPETFEFFMNDQKISEWTVNIPEEGVTKADFPTFQLNISPEEATNPNNTFDIKYKGNTLVRFKGGNN